MSFVNVTVGLAFLAGLASFLSPCVFSLVPAYVGYLSGRAAGGEANTSDRWVTFSHGLAFVLGFSLVFVLLGMTASVIGGLLYDLRIWLSKTGGIVMVLFGLHMTGIFRIPFWSMTLAANLFLTLNSAICPLRYWESFSRPAGRPVLGRCWARF